MLKEKSPIYTQSGSFVEVEEGEEMPKKKYSCDFETTTDPEDCRVWAYGWMEIGNTKNYKIGNSLDEFMTFVEKCQAELYFHNLRFDGSFIVNWLFKNGFEWSKEPVPRTFNTIISNMGQWYAIDICYGYRGKKKIHTVIYDSLKKLPFSVDKIGKDFGLTTKKIKLDEEFYTRYRAKGHVITEEEHEYILHDIKVVAEALKIQFDQGQTKMTNGSDSLFEYKSVISKVKFESLFPVLSFEMDAEIRKAYRGGFTWVNPKVQGVEIGEGMVFDVNSLYPSQMHSSSGRLLPYGLPIPFEGEYQPDEEYPLYIQKITCDFVIKEGYIPTIQLKNSPHIFKENEYLESSNWERPTFYVTNVDLELIREHYTLYNEEYLEGWKFKAQTGLFDEFINKWMFVKENSTGAPKQLAKLILNSLYGKFCSNPKVTGKIPYVKEDGSLGFSLPKDEEGNTIDEFKDPIYTPMGTFITAWARYTTITAAQSVFDRILYCDTDSIHIKGTDIPEAIRDIIHDSRLGYWKHESTFTRAKFIRQKTYCEEVNGHLDVKCAGMPENLKRMVTWENFKPGLVLPGKKMPQQVPGGIVLVNREFTLVDSRVKEDERLKDKGFIRKVMERAFREELKMTP